MSKRLEMLKERQKLLAQEISDKEKTISKRREEIIEQKRSAAKSQEGETIRREVKSIHTIALL